MARAVEQTLSGWGRFRTEPCRVYRPEKWRELAERVSDEPTLIARGAGRSYGDSAVNRSGSVVSFARLNRFLAFDPESGLLTCEAGVTLADILAVFLPRGYFLPVTPGTRFVSVGGAIAADVHGKNHHRDGTFSNFVLAFDLLTADGTVRLCSPEENRELFWATVGGAGLTGLIRTVQIRLMPVETAFVTVDYRPTGSLDETLDAFAEGDADYRYSVAWIDCLARGARLGRSVLIRGDHAGRDALRGAAGSPLALPKRRTVGVPFNMPSFALNRWGVKAFNALYYRTHPAADGKIEPLDSFFYPLDRIGQWNRLYGKRGFVQFQALFPSETSRAALRELLGRVQRSGCDSFLGVLKACGPAGKGLLSFPFPGHTLALDIQAGRGIDRLLTELDRLVLDQGGRLYLAKDAAMSAETFRASYSQLDRFLAVKRQVDPENRFSSSQSRRLGLTPLERPKEVG